MKITVDKLTPDQLKAMEDAVGRSKKIASRYDGIVKARNELETSSRDLYLNLNELETSSRDLYLNLNDTKSVFLDAQAKLDLHKFFYDYKERLLKEKSEIAVTL